VTVPAEVLLGFIEQTGTNPVWLLTGKGQKYRRGVEDQVLSDLSPEELIRRGLERLEERPNEVVMVASENLPESSGADFVAVGLVPMRALSGRAATANGGEGHVLAFRHWIPHPRDTVAVRLEDDAMSPILPAGSVAAVDRAVTDPTSLHGRLVAACPEGQPMIRWLEVSDRHLILRPNQPTREYPIVPTEWGGKGASPIVGQVVWSWSRFSDT
jgi:hypothetical protein